MKIFLYILTLLALPLSATAASHDDECVFMEEAKIIINKNPTHAANSDFSTGKVEFRLAGVGIASFLAGINNLNESTCVFNSYQNITIWGGGDYMQCEGQLSLGKEIVAYTNKYNIALKSILQSKGIYKCNM